MAILTTTANEAAHTVHPRMPVVLPDDEAAEMWLVTQTDESLLQELLVPAADGVIDAYPVDRRVNKPEHDSADCIEPL